MERLEFGSKSEQRAAWLRSRGWAAGLAMTTIPVLCLSTLILTPLRFEIRRQQALVEQWSQEANKEATLSAALLKARRLVQEAQRHWEEVRDAAPDTSGEAELFATITSAAARSGVTLQEFQPLGHVKTPNHSELRLQLMAIGPYENICQFLVALDQQPRKVRVTRWALRRTASGQVESELELSAPYGLQADSARRPEPSRGS
jgi:Tfp pilus assembly protein PilO